MRDNHCLIAVIMDRSGSMGGIMDETINSYNQFIEDQKKESGTAEIYFSCFDDHYDVLYDTDIKQVKPLTFAEVSPRGMTALNDAIGKTINTIGARLSKLPESERPNKIIVAIFTDGAENASKEYGGSKGRGIVADMIKHQQDKYNWVFTFFGANQDAVTTGSHYNIPASLSISYDSNKASAANTMSYMSVATSFMRSANVGTALPEDLVTKGKAAAKMKVKVDPSFYTSTEDGNAR